MRANTADKEYNPDGNDRVFAFDQSGNPITIPLTSIKDFVGASTSGITNTFILSEAAISDGSFVPDSLSIDSVTTLKFNNKSKSGLDILDFFQLLSNNKDDVLLKINEVGFEINAILKISAVTFNTDGTTTLNVSKHSNFKRSDFVLNKEYTLKLDAEYKPTSQPQSFIDNLVADFATIEAKRKEENQKISGTNEVDVAILNTTSKIIIGAINENKNRVDTNENNITLNTNNILALVSGQKYSIPRSGNTPADEPAPTVDGTYPINTTGTFTNFGGVNVASLNNVKAEIVVSDNQTVFTLNTTNIGINVNTVFNEDNNTEPSTMKASADYIKSKKFLETIGNTDFPTLPSTTASKILLSNGKQQNNGLFIEYNIRVTTSGEVVLKVFDKNLKLKGYQFLNVVTGINKFSVLDSTLKKMYILKDDYIFVHTPASVGVKYTNASSGDSYFFSTQDAWDSVSLTETLNGQIEMNTIIDYSEGSQLKAIEKRSLELTTIGYENINGVSATSSASPIFVSNFNPLPKGIVPILNVDIRAVNDGTLQALLIESNFNNGFNVLETANLTVTLTGRNTFKIPNWEINEKTFIAFQTTNGGATLGYEVANGEGYFYKVGTVAGNDNLPLFTQNGRIIYNVVVQKSEEDKPIENPILEEVTFESLPTNWINDGSFNFDGTKAVSTTTGLSNYLSSNLTFGINDRKLRWEFQLTNDAKVCFLTIPKEGGINAGSQIRVNAVDNTLEIMSNHNSSTVVSSVDLGFTIATGQKYIVEITKKGRTIKADLYGIDTNNFATIERTANVNYEVYPTFLGYNQGALHGSPAITTLSGVVNVFNFTHTYDAKTNPILKIDGDSITEGWLVKDEDTYGNLLKELLGKKEVVVSGIGGAKTEGLLKRFEVELFKIKPKYHLIYIGTNADSEFNQNLMMLLSLIIRNGSKPIIATIPTRTADTAFVNSLPNYITKVKFDLALTNSGAGSGVISEYYSSTDLSGVDYVDTLHPNKDGMQKKVERLITDVPYLFINKITKSETYIKKSFPYTSTYNTVSSNALSLVSSELFPAGVINKTKLNADSAGLGVFACLRNIGTREYEALSYFTLYLDAGVNSLELNHFVEEPFHLAYLKGSPPIKTAASDVGDEVNLHYTTLNIEPGVTLTESAGRGHNIAIEINTDASLFPIKQTGTLLELNGDSMTFFNENPHLGIQRIGYDKMISRTYKFTKINHNAVSGIKMAGSGGFADTRLASMQFAHIFSCRLGTNDFALATESDVGVLNDFINDTGITTFYGAYRKYFDRCFELNENADVILWTPSHRNYSSLNSWNSTNGNGNTLNDFAEVIREIAKYTGCYLIDLLKYNGLKSGAQIQKEIDLLTYDGLHRNNLGNYFDALHFIETTKSLLDRK